jgi:hypothetical protein
MREDAVSFVIGRNTAFTFKGKRVDLKQVGRGAVVGPCENNRTGRSRSFLKIRPKAARIQIRRCSNLLDHVPVGRCNAVRVRCRTSHFECPARASVAVRNAGGHVVGRPRI